jgi:hypothetical protein
VVDSDGDDIDDFDEAGFGTSPTSADSDGDRLGVVLLMTGLIASGMVLAVNYRKNKPRHTPHS